MPTTFFDLPPEIRDEIYVYVFTGLRAATIPIYKLPDRPNWLLRTHSGISSPSILRACRACFLEAYPIFIKQTGAPLLQIEHPFLVEVSCVPNQPAPLYWWRKGLPPSRHVKPETRPLSTALLPILLSVPSLRIEIAMPRGKWMIAETETERIVALLHWMRALFAVRCAQTTAPERCTSACRMELGCLLIVLGLTLSGRTPCHRTLQVLQRATDTFATVCRELRVERQWGRGRDERVVVGEFKGGGKKVHERGEDWKGVERAWKKLLKSCGESERERWYWACVRVWREIRDHAVGLLFE